jgi:hypothetical protein
LDATFSHCSPNKQGNKEGRVSAAAVANLKVKGGVVSSDPIATDKGEEEKGQKKDPLLCNTNKEIFFNI